MSSIVWKGSKFLFKSQIKKGIISGLKEGILSSREETDQKLGKVSKGFFNSVLKHRKASSGVAIGVSVVVIGGILALGALGIFMSPWFFVAAGVALLGYSLISGWIAGKVVGQVANNQVSAIREKIKELKASLAQQIENYNDMVHPEASKVVNEIATGMKKAEDHLYKFPKKIEDLKKEIDGKKEKLKKLNNELLATVEDSFKSNENKKEQIIEQINSSQSKIEAFSEEVESIAGHFEKLQEATVNVGSHFKVFSSKQKPSMMDKAYLKTYNAVHDENESDEMVLVRKDNKVEVREINAEKNHEKAKEKQQQIVAVENHPIIGTAVKISIAEINEAFGKVEERIAELNTYIKGDMKGELPKAKHPELTGEIEGIAATAKSAAERIKRQLERDKRNNDFMLKQLVSTVLRLNKNKYLNKNKEKARTITKLSVKDEKGLAAQENFERQVQNIVPNESKIYANRQQSEASSRMEKLGKKIIDTQRGKENLEEINRLKEQAAINIKKKKKADEQLKEEKLKDDLKKVTSNVNNVVQEVAENDLKGQLDHEFVMREIKVKKEKNDNLEIVCLEDVSAEEILEQRNFQNQMKDKKQNEVKIKKMKNKSDKNIAEKELNKKNEDLVMKIAQEENEKYMNHQKRQAIAEKELNKKNEDLVMKIAQEENEKYMNHQKRQTIEKKKAKIQTKQKQNEVRKQIKQKQKGVRKQKKLDLTYANGKRAQEKMTDEEIMAKALEAARKAQGLN